MDVSTDLGAASLENELRTIDWTRPLRTVQVDVGDVPVRFTLDARLLIARSPHFAKVLGSGMRESEEGAVIRLEDTTPEVMQSFMHFLHTDGFKPEKDVVRGQDMDAAFFAGRLSLAVHRFADRYGVFRLQKLALLELQKALSAATALPLLEEAAGDRAWNPEEEEAPRVCWEACVEHFGEILENHGEAVDGLVRRRPVLAARIIRSMAPKALGPPVRCEDTSKEA